MLYQSKHRVESTRLPGWDYRSRGWYFVTICSAHRECIFGTVIEAKVRLSHIGVIADAELKAMPSHYRNVELVEHVVMPNHVHAMVMIDGEHMFSSTAKMSFERTTATFSPPKAGSLAAIIRSYKAGVTQRAREARCASDVWQAGFYDHILRGEKVIAAVREYIRKNPENWEKDGDNLQHDCPAW
jgi:REP element-mobilizing transposase RayT